MTTLLMILGAMAIGLGVGLLDPGNRKPKKGLKPKKPRKKRKDDFWDYAWS